MMETKQELEFKIEIDNQKIDRMITKDEEDHFCYLLFLDYTLQSDLISQNWMKLGEIR